MFAVAVYCLPNLDPTQPPIERHCSFRSKKEMNVIAYRKPKQEDGAVSKAKVNKLQLPKAQGNPEVGTTRWSYGAN